MSKDWERLPAFRVQRQHLLIEPREPTLVFGDHDWSKRPVTIAWDVQIDRADIGLDPFRGRPVTGVARTRWSAVMSVVTQMIIEFNTQRGLQNLSHQPR